MDVKILRFLELSSEFCKEPEDYLMWPRIPRALGSLEWGGKEKRIERFKETGK